MNNKGSGLTPAQALDKLDALYEQSVVALRNAIGKYITSGELPDENARKQGLFVYPSLTVTWDGSTTNPPKTRAFGRFTHAGSYTTTITRPTALLSFVRISMNNLRCCIRIMVRISLCNPRSMKSLILMSSMALN
ncbi:AMP nucleosidase [Escherichia coli]|nr:AMP nucleosidase [Escherichia coli]